MSDVIDFISRVVPWGHGLINLHWLSKPGFMPGLPFTTAQDFLNFAAYAASRPKLYGGVYFCLSSQLKAGKTVNGKTWALRNHENVAAFKAIWLDVDGYKAEKGYASLPDALDATKQFLNVAS